MLKKECIERVQVKDFFIIPHTLTGSYWVCKRDGRIVKEELSVESSRVWIEKQYSAEHSELVDLIKKEVKKER